MTSLNPVFTVGEQVAEPLVRHRGLTRRQALARAVELLALVGIPDPAGRAGSYPHELSGGMRQRVMIAMALSCDPDILIADEPTTALDVTIQAQILELMAELRAKSDAALLLITHDLGVVAGYCRRVAVMYAGRVVEEAGVRDLFARAAHPYTQGLLASLPGRGLLEGKPGRLTPIPGTVPSIYALPRGCAFHPRCPHAFDHCREEAPPLLPVEGGGEGQAARCWLVATQEKNQEENQKK
jgi:oligopeptide/dipeptide ABC transporter ATP-binding protein